MNHYQPFDIRSLLQTSNEINEKDVRHLRREVFRDGLVSELEADNMFVLQHSTQTQCNEWAEFFVEALTDYCVHQAEPRGYVSGKNAEWLIKRINQGGRIPSCTDLELAINILEKTEKTPQILQFFVLNHIAIAIMDGEGVLVKGHVLEPGIIGEAEVELLRRVLFSYSGEGGVAISRAEAELLFELNDKTVGAQNHPSWNDLFVKAVANHLMAFSGYEVPDRQTALAREAWLEDCSADPVGLVMQSVQSVGQLFSSLRDMFVAEDRLEFAWAKKNRAMEAGMDQAQAITQNESHWLIERIRSNDHLDQNEKALLAFIEQNSSRIHPSLRDLLDEAA